MEKFFKILKNAEDLSLSLKSFASPNIPFALLSTDVFYIGFEKIFRQFFVSFEVLNTNPAVMSFEYFNGAVWLPLTNSDETFSFSKNGFVNFAPPIDWAKGGPDSDNFYIRLKSNVNFIAGTKLQGLAIMLSNDTDLEGIRSDIVSKYNKGKSWVTKHEEARKQIIQRIRNAGHKKVSEGTSNSSLYFGNTSSLYFDDITEFDLLKPFELREASKYLTIALIYLNELTDQVDDKFERAGKHYMALYSEFMNVYMLKLDNNDNGIEDAGEGYGDTGINLRWQ
jgi:hypothetical protein